MRFSVGDVIAIKGEQFNIVGKITYRNKVDGCIWDEYRMFTLGTKVEKWLSVDDHFKEYSISMPAEQNFPKERYHEVDRGVEVVVGHMGSVDVDTGEQASFVEYEDATEEYIYSEERWSDGVERSKGIYLDENEIRLISHDEKAEKKYRTSGMSSDSVGTIMGIVAVCVIFLWSGVASCWDSWFPPKIAKFLEKSPAFTYETSITGAKNQKADVYSTTYDLDMATRMILQQINGNTEYVQQNDEADDDSVAILTKKEYCLVYTSEEGKTMVQISGRKFAYTTDEEPWHSRVSTRRYYRRYYYWRGYQSDARRYKKYSSPYSSYGNSEDAKKGLGSDYGDTYSNYSASVRQSSLSSRESSGGGTSYGK